MQNEYAVSDEEDFGNDLGVRLKGNINIDDLREGKGVEFDIDEASLPTRNSEPDESSSYFEHGEVYKNSELYALGESDSDSDGGEEGLVSFDKLKSKMAPVVEDGGVLKRILRPGMGPTIQESVKELQEKEMQKEEGDRRQIAEDDIQIAYHYSATQEGENEPFDVTYLRNDRPQKAYLNDEFFPGFKCALASMKEKELADFLIRSDYAYGHLGCAPRIKPNATLRYKVEMVKYWATTELDAYAKMSREDKRSVPVSKLVKLCSKQRENANKLYNNADFKGANLLYGKAIRILEDANLQNDEDEVLQMRALLKLYLNRSLCAIKLSRWDLAITYSNKALDIEPKNAKALYRKAKAKMEFKDFMQAKRIAQLARSEYPNDQAIGRLLSDIHSREEQERKKEKLMCQKMFNQVEQPRSAVSLYTPEQLAKCQSEISQFMECGLKELKLSASTYTAKEMDALAYTASTMNLTVLPNKEKEEWISLKLRKE